MTKRQRELLVEMLLAIDDASMASEQARTYTGTCFIEAIHAIAQRASDRKANAVAAFIESYDSEIVSG